jgi:predicted ATPase/DNA-binding XRE family transcriptional regulator
MHGEAGSFGELLRRLRTGAALSQEALAERAGLSLRGISDLERGVHRAPHLATVGMLADALALGPEDRQALIAAARPNASDEPRSAPPVDVARLPRPLTSLYGRTRELADLIALLRQDAARLVTVTGPGGSGKTRLALEVGARLEAESAERVVFVDLSPLRDAALVILAIARALGVRERAGQPLVETLASALASVRVVIVLDNCEHVLAAASDVAAVLARCPRVAILATSREPLRVRGERRFPLQPLRLSGDDLPEIQELARVPAVALFTERAQAVDSGFALTEENAAAVAAICRRLDGLPLAIELAAARVPLLAPNALLARLERTLPLLTGGARDLPPRQRTLRDAIAWSYDLLSPEEQALFRRMSVFVGGCTLEAVEAVTGADHDALGGLERLVDHNLIRHQQTEGPRGDPRFAMLGSVQEYGLEQLEASGEAETIRRQHGGFFLDLAEASVDGLRSADMARWIERLEADHDNLRAVLTWATERNQGALALRLAAALRILWLQNAHISEARFWLARALALDHDDPRARSAALFAAAVFEQNDPQRAALADEALVVAQAHDDRIGAVRALSVLGNLAADRGDAKRAQTLLGDALTLAQQAGDARWMGSIEADLGAWALGRGELGAAEAHFQSALANLQRVGYAWNEANVLGGLSAVAQRRGDARRAVQLQRESLARHHTLRSRWGMLGAVERLAALEATTEPVRAIRWYAAASALRESVGARLPTADQARRDHDIAGLRKRVGEEQFIDAWGWDGRRRGPTLWPKPWESPKIAVVQRIERVASLRRPENAHISAPITR